MTDQGQIRFTGTVNRQVDLSDAELLVAVLGQVKHFGVVDYVSTEKAGATLKDLEPIASIEWPRKCKSSNETFHFG